MQRLKALLTDEAVLKKMGQQARSAIEGRNQLDHMIAHYVDLLIRSQDAQQLPRIIHYSPMINVSSTFSHQVTMFLQLTDRMFNLRRLSTF